MDFQIDLQQDEILLSQSTRVTVGFQLTASLSKSGFLPRVQW